MSPPFPPPPPPPPVEDWPPARPARRHWREEHWLVNLGALVMFLAVTWLIMAGLVIGAAFIVSWAGGDVVEWLIGYPALAALIGFSTALVAERVFNRKRERGDG